MQDAIANDDTALSRLSLQVKELSSVVSMGFVIVEEHSA